MERGDLALDHWELLAGGLKHRMVERPVELVGRGKECTSGSVMSLQRAEIAGRDALCRAPGRLWSVR